MLIYDLKIDFEASVNGCLKLHAYIYMALLRRGFEMRSDVIYRFTN